MRILIQAEKNGDSMDVRTVVGDEYPTDEVALALAAALMATTECDGLTGDGLLKWFTMVVQSNDVPAHLIHVSKGEEVEA